MNIKEEQELIHLKLKQVEQLSLVDLKYSLINVSSYNCFGHPNDEVLEKLMNKDVQIWQTNLHGRVIITFHDKLEIGTLRL